MRQERAEPCRRERFGKEISNIVFARDTRKRNVRRIEVFSNKVIFRIKVFVTWSDHMKSSSLNSRKIIRENGSRFMSCSKTKFIKKSTAPESLTERVIESNVFSICGGCSNSRLAF